MWANGTSELINNHYNGIKIINSFQEVNKSVRRTFFVIFPSTAYLRLLRSSRNFQNIIRLIIINLLFLTPYVLIVTGSHLIFIES